MRCDCVVMLTVRPKYVVYCSLTKFHLYIVPILENTSIRNVVHSIAFILPCSVQYFWWIVDKKMIYVNKSFQYCFRTEFRHIVNCAAARVLVWRLWLCYKHLVWNESVVITTARGMFWGQDNYMVITSCFPWNGWWRHDMKTFSALVTLCEASPSVIILLTSTSVAEL